MICLKSEHVEELARLHAENNALNLRIAMLREHIGHQDKMIKLLEGEREQLVDWFFKLDAPVPLPKELTSRAGSGFPTPPAKARDWLREADRMEQQANGTTQRL